MNGETLKEKLREGAVVYGTHVIGLSSSMMPRLLSAAPLDFVFVCNEHIPLDRAETSALCQQFGAMGISPMVRISRPCPAEAAMALDGGAEGIVVPYVETIEEVKALVGAVHYRPIKGRQLREFLDGTRSPTEETRAFLKRFNRHQYLFVGVESVEAYKNLDRLLDIEGVNGVFMGPHDLSVSLEAPERWDHPALIELIEDTIVRCRARKVGVGVHLTAGLFSEERIHRFRSLGMNWILDAADLTHSRETLKARRAMFCGETDMLPRTSGEISVGCVAPTMPAPVK